MNLIELTARLEKGENLHTEFKEWPIYPDDLAPSIVAFANTDGGQIFLGIGNRAQVVGIDENELDRATQFVDNVAFNNCEPPVTVVQETIRDERGRVALVIYIPKGDQRPYRTNRGIYYIRTSSGRRQASREELLRLFQSTESLYYDETLVTRSRAADLDDQAVEEILEAIKEQEFDVAGIPRDRLLRNWRLVRATNGEIRPTLAGVLFLARFPQQFLPYAYISALRIPGIEISREPQDQKRIEGRLVEMLRDTMKFLHIYLMRPHRIQGLEPEVRPELPVEVLREALVNALAHRDYTISGPVRVIVYDDRVEIRTPGQLPNTVTIESLRLGVHVLRNPTIYNIFLKVGLVTDAGSGIPRMIRLLRETTNREPDFRLEGNEFVVVLPRSSKGG
ncbi:MAG: putative DNA binding domain-containing protein [Candidatus Tectomicrobia bacterium]|nr:putative DNA binding domain-containing protein [Candidatus Tectomicrobia bacterium]